MVQIASDLSLLPRPVPVPGLRLTPAERAEVVIDFSRYRLGTRLVLSDAAAGPVMCFDVTRVAPDNSRVPAAFGPALARPLAAVTRRFELMIDARTGTFLLNGRSFDPGRADVTVRRGSTEIWEVHNASPASAPFPHNFQVVRCTVLSRNGVPPPATETGWQDTVSLAPGESVRLLTAFSQYPGRQVFGCHLLDHSCAAAGRLDVVA
jgi:FtsP/CotA-like multicopper oxidase with cupredoxin domain